MLQWPHTENGVENTSTSKEKRWHFLNIPIYKYYRTLGQGLKMEMSVGTNRYWLVLSQESDRRWEQGWGVTQSPLRGLAWLSTSQLLLQGEAAMSPVLLICQDKPALWILIWNFSVFIYWLKRIEMQYHVTIRSLGSRPRSTGFFESQSCHLPACVLDQLTKSPHVFFSSEKPLPVEGNISAYFIGLV